MECRTERTSEEGRQVQRPKRCGNNAKDEDINKNVNNRYSSKNFRQKGFNSVPNLMEEYLFGIRRSLFLIDNQSEEGSTRESDKLNQILNYIYLK